MLVFHGGKEMSKLLTLVGSQCHQLVTGWGLHQDLRSVRWGSGFQAPA